LPDLPTQQLTFGTSLMTTQRPLTWMLAIIGGTTLLTSGAAAEEPHEKRTAAPSPADVEFFEQQIKPILQANCWKCHGPVKQNGGLRLDHRTFILRGGDLGPAVSLEDPSDSNLLRAINYEELEMPPTGRLANEQIERLTDWVRRGVPWSAEAPPVEAHAGAEAAMPTAEAAPHWAYQTLRMPQLPAVNDRAWAANPIDRFVLARLQRHALKPNPPASRGALIRRLYFDLLGLPPTLKEVESFSADKHPAAYVTRVDQLLARPQFGEKWGRHWLDLVRFAETNGYERDGPKENAWRYRDYVIDALNSDKPYDRFVREQLAGDELPDGDTSALIATGYYRLGLWDDEPVDADQAYYDSLDDVVSTTGMVFLATTIGCARCHDHKIDPIPQRDYYRMLAFFHNIQKDIGQMEFKKSPFTLNTQTVIASGAEREEFSRHEEGQTRREQLQEVVEQIEQQVFAALSNPEKEDARDAGVRRQLIAQRAAESLSAELFRQYQDARKELRRLRRRRSESLPSALTIRENGREAPETFILIRGNVHAPGEQVEPGFPAALSDQAPAFPELPESIPSCGRRTALANWIVDARNPLTARVIVNRVWQHHFGRGLVRTSSDFGRYGEAPTHAELLDYLAVELVRHDWQLKWLHHLILTSQTYQMSSADNADGLAADPANNLFWRFDMRRLTAEELRDTVLSVTGMLNMNMGGPSVYSTIPDEVLQSASRPDAAWGQSSPADQSRRSVYVFVKRSISDPVLLAFDAADKDSSCPVRFATTVPTQALTTLNGEFFHEQSELFAARMRREAGDNRQQQVTRALTLALSRQPMVDEVARGMELIEQWQTEDNLPADEALKCFCLLVLNLNELVYVD
jgi:hypothetical protein